MHETGRRLELSHPCLPEIGRIADVDGVRAYVVGGYVRDLLLGRRDQDLDIMVMGDGVAFARRAARSLGITTVVAFERFGTAMIPVAGGKIEVVGARREVYHPESRDPDVAAGTLEEDLLRRDFTVNAMAAWKAYCCGPLVTRGGHLRTIRCVSCAPFASRRS